MRVSQRVGVLVHPFYFEAVAPKKILSRFRLSQKNTTPDPRVDAQAETVRRETATTQSEVSTGSQEGECDDGL